jgi:galactose-1-phosphate uridylyltransferase
MRLHIRCAAKPAYHHHPYFEGLNQFHLIPKENIFYFKYFSRGNNKLIREYITKFTYQYDNNIVNPFMKLRLFGSSLPKITFY